MRNSETPKGTSIVIVILILTVIVVMFILNMPTVKSAQSVQSTPITHTCIDPDHTSCDGNCSCDGMECDATVYNKAVDEIVANAVNLLTVKHNISMKNYQLDIIDNGNKILLCRNDTVVHMFNGNDKQDAHFFKVIERDYE